MNTSPLAHNFRSWVRRASLAEIVVIVEGIERELLDRAEPGSVELHRAAEIFSRRLAAARAERRATGR